MTVISEDVEVREERTGLHELEFIEVRRHWFGTESHHDTEGTVNVLNLVEGDEVEIASPQTPSRPTPFTTLRPSSFLQTSVLTWSAVHRHHGASVLPRSRRMSAVLAVATVEGRREITPSVL
jgi:hypothetical protein